MRPDVSVDNLSIPGARGQNGGVPGRGAHASVVAGEGPHAFLTGQVPQEHTAAAGAHRDVVAGGRGGHTRDGVRVAEVAQLGDLGGAGVPHVDRAGQAYHQVVGLGPVQEVQVEVVCEGGRVQDLVGRLWDTPGGKQGLVEVRAGKSAGFVLFA